MIALHSSLQRLRLAANSTSAIIGLALLAGPSAYAKPVPSNLGNGLDKLIASNLAITEAKASGRRLEAVVSVNGKTYTDSATAAVASSSIRDERGRVLVRVNLNSDAKFNRIKRAMKATASTLTITAIDKNYKGAGVLNAYVDVSEVPALAKVKGVTSVILEWKPQTRKTILDGATLSLSDPGATVGETLTKVGTAFDQGVTQHRVDQISSFYNAAATLNLAGQGMQIACISNSFAANAANPASTDVTNGDLPGAVGSTVNTTPVFVLQDDLSSTTSDDEGRGMCQIVYKMAPKATIGFATANTGEVGFANNIRGLAGIPGYTDHRPDVRRRRDLRRRGLLRRAVLPGRHHLAAASKTPAPPACAYFSSAANDIGTNGYDSRHALGRQRHRPDRRRRQHRARRHEHQPDQRADQPVRGWFPQLQPESGPIGRGADGQHRRRQHGADVFQWNDPTTRTRGQQSRARLFNGGGTYTTAAVNFTVTGDCDGGHQLPGRRSRHQQQWLRRHRHGVQVRRHDGPRRAAGHGHGRNGALHRTGQRHGLRGQSRPFRHDDGHVLA